MNSYEILMDNPTGLKLKRHREDDEQPQKFCSAYFCCGGWRALLVLRRPVTAEAIEEKHFPGLTFFFLPQVIGMQNGRLLLSIESSSSLCDRVHMNLQWKPCRTHGPFRCSCHVFEQIARSVFQLEWELMQHHRQLEVVMDDEPQHDDVPSFHINTTGRIALLNLCGLPIPTRQYGPFPLCSVDNRASIKRAVEVGFRGSEGIVNNEPKCVLCRVVTEVICNICRSALCRNCSARCAYCSNTMCTTCAVSSADAYEEGTTLYCFQCCPAFV
ncbi:hypothetical protein TRVL_06158 [Trypanosoma vivax]|nr:hypothetical protein TRVL_06158 [Trypanosoma vivax]